MGHMCAPEIQRTLTAVMAGHPDYAQTSFPQCGDLDIYLDGLRWSGSEHERCQYEKWMERRAKQLRMTFKKIDSNNGPEYEFLGVQYDHSAKMYKLADTL